MLRTTLCALLALMLAGCNKSAPPSPSSLLFHVTPVTTIVDVLTVNGVSYAHPAVVITNDLDESLFIERISFAVYDSNDRALKSIDAQFGTMPPRGSQRVSLDSNDLFWVWVGPAAYVTVVFVSRGLTSTTRLPVRTVLPV